MKDVVERLVARGLVRLPETHQDGPVRSPAPRTATLMPEPLPRTTQTARAYHTARKRAALGYQCWKPGGPGRKPLGVCRWCGRNGGHTGGCKRPGR